jgi:hypothetical protein
MFPPCPRCGLPHPVNGQAFEVRLLDSWHRRLAISACELELDAHERRHYQNILRYVNERNNQIWKLDLVRNVPRLRDPSDASS